MVIIGILLSTLVFVFLLLLAAGLFLHGKLFGSRFVHDPLVKTYEAEGLGLRVEEVSFPAGKETLYGAFFTPAEGEVQKDTLVVFCHGMWSSHKSYMQEIGYLAAHGYRVFSYDAVGVGKSGGACIGGFGGSLASLDAALCYLKNEQGYRGEHIFLMGHSWGGYAVTNVPPLHPDVAGIVAFAPATSFPAVVKSVLPRRAQPLAVFLWLADILKMGKYAATSAHKALKGYRGEVMILHSKNDHLCAFPATTGHLMRTLTGENFHYFVTDGKYHNPQYTKAGVEMMMAYTEKLRQLPDKAARDAYKKTVDFLAMGALDGEVMDVALSVLPRG